MAQKNKQKKKIKPMQTSSLPTAPFVSNGTLIVPIPDIDPSLPTMMTPQEFMRNSYKMSDKDMNKMMYEQAKAMIRLGENPEWPEDDFGAFMWFTWNFITPEMREAFPDIAREYLAHEPMIGTSFTEVPYPMMNETTWDDAYYFRVIAIMLAAARRGSAYSRNFLISLYKVYYKPEYNRLKQLKNLTYLNLLELHDEDCKRKGYASGHTVDGQRSYGEAIIEERQHEAGWTNVYGNRSLSARPNKPSQETVEHFGTDYKNAADYVRGMTDAPDEPPLQPTAARLFIMCELMRIPIEETCNIQAMHLNTATESMLTLSFRNSPEYRQFWTEMVERSKEFFSAELPEIFDPFLYQSDERFFPLEVAERVLLSAFKKMDRNFRMPYDSKEFKLADLVADVNVTLNAEFPEYLPSFGDVLHLAMVEYLGECLCELMNARDGELEDILKFDRRFFKGEWSGVVAAERKDVKADKLLKTLEGMRQDEPPLATIVEKPPETEEELKAKVDELQKELEERELALAEAEQKAILQRALYERESKERGELERRVYEAGVEHSELIALREYVYSLRDESEIELDEKTKEEMIKAVQNKNVAVLGGTERWVKRMKKLYPKWLFISVEDGSQGAMNSLESADFIYIYTSALKHDQYYRAMDMIKRKGKMLLYLGSTNTNENVSRFYRDLCR